jgi:hypothetical protein
MNLIKEFKINQYSSIKILIPDLKDKFNYYYEPIKKLHMFDEVTAVFEKETQQTSLIIDNVNIVIHNFKEALEYALDNKIVLPDFIKAGELGFYYNIDIYNEKTESVDYSYFWLWSIRGTQTWLYNQNNKIYLEIGPSYPWLFVEPKKSDNYITFDEFMKTYKPIIIEEIDSAIVQKWLEQCNEILNNMIMVHSKDNS